ncbi:thioredoxin family protein [Pseudomonas synxantha]|uniref:Thiol reductase thioredoxin n=2 Tax=Pseudomonas synxantha TaxID=47883 RepID=A0ABS0ULY0_9PSED|nr:thioredoxin domain-containing protein [Pseudomonas synxantha]AZE72931.1 Thioredoxin [Pseudomonas synxantha]AZE78589.1 Thioredoxin [Pseudomonas synxantha]MBI6566598.1 thiol reductase thioredoxin [Pseudomonas synxantha]MBI6579675.1 thiol reductase thioredoxin [Pseudomonas synxantha]MBI6647148.1 thiol reductase thioredoxin [Pseudomonas synxantha]
MLVTNLKAISDASFKSEVLEAAGPVLVCYMDDACAPPAFLDQFAEYYSGRLTIVTLNMDENPITPAKYGVGKAPMLMLFKDKRSFS